jgi:hypothetical protein
MLMRLCLLLLTCCFYGIAQEGSRETLLDSLNTVRDKDKGAFNLYVKKAEFEIIPGVYRNRTSPTQGFEPVNFIYHVFLPFQFDLNYVNVKAKDKLLKLNSTFIVHHSKYGNYALGLGQRFSFLLLRKTYLSYQIGLVWCEVVKKKTNDGFNEMGFALHHEFSLNYEFTKHLRCSVNAIHLSSGNFFGDAENLQDVLGIGLSYAF